MATLAFDTATVIDILLGDDVTPETIDMIAQRLDKIVMPWRPDTSVPPDYHRATASGACLATVTARLGGFTWPHTPRHHGWGYSTSGYGAVERGIVEVVFGAGDSEKTIVAAERVAMLAAMKKIDTFLKQERPDLVLLSEPLKESK